MKIDSPVLLDSNVLIYAQAKHSQFYQQAQAVHQAVKAEKINAYLTFQNMNEFFSIITNPRRVEKPLTSKQALVEIDKYLYSGLFTFIWENSSTLELTRQWLEKVKLNHPSQIFDLKLAAVGLSNGVPNIITANVQDFEFIPGLKIFSLKEF